MKGLLPPDPRYVLFGFLLAFFSGFGQTFLISLFVPHLQLMTGLNDGLFSALYSVATLGSAFTLAWIGRFIDTVRLDRFTLFVMAGMVVALLLLSLSQRTIMLVIALYGLRLFGQGLMTHTSITSMVRFYKEKRGQALAFAALGHPAGEAVMPVLVLGLIALTSWRTAALIMAAVVVLATPLLLRILLRDRAHGQLRMIIPAPVSAEGMAAAKPMAIMRNAAFWTFAPSNFVAASVGTAFIFFQFRFAEAWGWSPSFIAAAFSGYAIGSALNTFIAGWLADHFGGARSYPVYLLPFMIGLVMLLVQPGQSSFAVLLTGIGMSTGLGGTLKNAALADRFGTQVIGAVRSLFTTVMVISTAVGPLVFGWLLDAGLDMLQLATGSLVLMALATINALRGSTARQGGRSIAQVN